MPYGEAGSRTAVDEFILCLDDRVLAYWTSNSFNSKHKSFYSILIASF